MSKTTKHVNPNEWQYHQDQRDKAMGYSAVILLALFIIVLLCIVYFVVPIIAATLEAAISFIICLGFLAFG